MQRLGLETFIFFIAVAILTAYGQPKENQLCSITPEQGQLFASQQFSQEIGYRNRYSKFDDDKDKQMCNYTLTTKNQDSLVKLTFYIFDLPHSWDCERESVTIYDSNGTAIHKYCDTSTNPLVVTSSGNSLSLSHQFRLGYRYYTTGFLAEWNEVKMDVKKKNNYLITYPHTILELSEDKVCLEVYCNGQDRGNGEFIVNVFTGNPIQKYAKISQFEKISAEEYTKCLTIKIPRFQDSKISSAFLEFVGHFENSAFNIRAFTKIKIIREEIFNLIQTDKGKYNPKDTVKFRILLINNHLMAAKIEMIKEIWVEDPEERRIEQWKNLTLKKGMLQQSFVLSEEPELGTWTIHFETEKTQIKTSWKKGGRSGKAQFIVSEHILPKFEVKIESPAAVLWDTKNITWKVCGVYTHGGPVLGSVKANFTSLYTIRNRVFPFEKVKRIVQVEKKINPKEKCATIELDRKELLKMTNNGKHPGFNMNVELEESVTSIRVAAEKTQYLKNEPFLIITTPSSTPFILSGFPNKAEFQVINHDGTSRSGEELKVCARLFRDITEFRFPIWSMEEDEILGLMKKIPKLHYRSQCHTFKTDKDGILHFFIPLVDVPKDVVKLSIKVTAINFPKNETTMMKQPMAKFDVSLSHVNSTWDVSFQEKDSLMITCDEKFISKVYFSNKPGTSFDFYYKIISNGKIFQSKTVNINMGYVDETKELVRDAKLLTTQSIKEVKTSEKIIRTYNISIPIDYKLSPTMNVIVFALDANETVVSTSHVYNVESCQKHKVSGKWSKDEVYPGTPITYSIVSGSKSVCGVSAIDKSVDILGNDNKITGERVRELQTRINDRKTRSDAYYPCDKTKKFVQQFAKSGINIVSDLTIITSCETVRDVFRVVEISTGVIYSDFSQNLCQTDGLGEVVGLKSMAKVDEPSMSLRSYFPETWLFELMDVNYEFEFNLTSPHTITEWKAESYCMNDDNGLGVSKPQPLLVNQDFFANLILPYSVKRGEGFPLNVSISNNINEDLPIRVTIKNNNKKLMMRQNKFYLCIVAKSNQIISIETTAKELGIVNITVEAKITNGITGCKNVIQGEGFTDALVKPLLVKPEGFPVEKVESELLCKNDEDGSSKSTIIMTPLTTPVDTVPDSERSWVYVTGDIMAPSLQNIDNLVNLPMGCGEQNMARLVPNIYLLQYLNATGKKEPNLERKARMYIKIGFIRQEEYRHGDGSYSIWGKGNGSTWLTAFVLKSFSEASSLVSIRNPPLKFMQKSIDWLMMDQKEDGCFLKKGYTHSISLKGGANEDSLTPFVILSLLQSQDINITTIVEKKLMKAVECMLNNFDINQFYSASMTTYVANLFNRKIQLPLSTKQKIESLWPQILKEANTSLPGALFWDSGPKASNQLYSHSKSIEITAYNILTMALLDQLSDAVQAVKWLARQRNSYGGFVSTQDTVVALQALSVYTQKVIAYPLDMFIDIEENNLSTPYRLTPDNALLLQTQKLSNHSSKISLKYSGSGCALVQTVLRYNQKTSQDNQGFSITVKNIFNKALRICYKYTGSKENTEMTVMEVELVTGWVAHSLDLLVNDVNNYLRRFDKNEDKVVLYFDEVTRNEECLEIEVTQMITVQNPNTAIVKMYDYYDTDDNVSIQYHM